MTPREAVLALVVLPLLLLAAIALSTPLTEHHGGWDSDGRFYGAVLLQLRNDAPLAEVPRPWRFRVLTPFLASLLPLHPLTSFLAVGFASNWISLALLYAISRRSGGSSRDATIAVLLYVGVFWAVKFSFYSPAYVDFQTQTFLLIALFLVVSRVYWAVPLVLGVGALQKEAMPAFAVLAYAHYAQASGRLGGRSLAYLAILVAVPVAAQGALRLAIPLDLLDPTPEDRGILPPLHRIPIALGELARLSDPANAWRFAIAVFSGLGLLPLILLLGPRAAWRYLRANAHWVVLVAIGSGFLLFGTDKSRLFLTMLPAVVLTAVAVIHPWLEGGSRAAAFWLVATLLLHAYLGHHFTPMGSFAEYKSWLVPIHSQASPLPQLLRIAFVCGIWGALTFWLRSRGHLGARGPSRSRRCRR